MDTGLKQRLIGAAVLVALAVIFLPMLVKGPAPDSGVSSVSLDMPDAPDGATETRELPLVTPGDVPKGGALGMDARPVDTTAAPATPTDPAAATGVAADPAADPTAPAAATAPTPDATASGLPPTAAGGDFAVHFGAYASEKGAQTVADLARKAQLPAYTEAAIVNGKPAWRVRIGPYATRADAEAARLKAVDVRADVPVRVISLDAEAAAAAKAAELAAQQAAAQPVAPPPATRPAPVVETRPKKPEPAATPTTAKVETKPQPAKPVAPKPADKPVAAAKPPVAAPPKPAAPAASKVGFAVQAGAFSDAAEAVALRDRLRGAGFSAFVETVNTDKGPLTRVRVGPVVDRAAADQLKAQVQSKTGVEGFVRPHP